MKIDLFGLTQTILIVPANTGIIYTNQAGGTECDHPELEGFLIPVEYDYLLENYDDSLTGSICKLFPEGGRGGIDQTIALQIQRLFDRSPFTVGIEIDWDNLSRSKESWLNVVVTGTLEGIIEKDVIIGCILTWPNSD